MVPSAAFLPVSRADMSARGWDSCDFILVSGDAYVDHPSFGAAIISRVLEAEGYTVGIIAQPDWRRASAFAVLGKPRLAFLVTAGNLDSMVSRYTANKKPRSEDAYSPGGKAGLRPDRALIAYCNKIREAFPGVSIVIGGIEASLRRLSHYDYWSDTIKKSVLLDAKADILVYGMGERAIRAIARRLADGETPRTLKDIPGTVWRSGREAEIPPGAVILPAHEEQARDNPAFARAFLHQYRNADDEGAPPLAEPSAGGWAVQNPPSPPLSMEEMDAVYALPFTRASHPLYEKDGGVPALEEVRFSITSSRGCFGSCSFCALSFHQGRRVRGRSQASILAEAEKFLRMPGFKGVISDVGGPTANFRAPPCERQKKEAPCPDRRCLFPEPCPGLEADHAEYLSILRRLRALPGVKHVFIRSGIRFDYLILDKDPAFLEELCAHHVSGQLKVAPEHVSDRVLAVMGKPGRSSYLEFEKAFARAAEKAGKPYYLLPYYISAHPGSTLEDAIELALALKEAGFVPDQIQDFYPTPGTLSTCMYRTGIDPLTGNAVHIPKGERERRLQRALAHFHKKENAPLVREALLAAGREDLIGSGKGCLVRD
jgi:uncharacterized radical SAM protein YgiQ